MIRLRHDCLEFKTSDGEIVPCSAQEMTIELMGEAVAQLDEEIIQNAALGVLHFFKEEKGQTTVTVGEFSQALELALRALGLNMKADAPPLPPASTPPRVADADLRALAREAEEGFELMFFSRLRAELRDKLGQAPQVVRFRGLRGCVKQLTGAKRWSGRCQDCSDQIVEYLRTCLSAEPAAASCALVVL